LEQAAEHDVHPGKKKAQTDDTQRRLANVAKVASLAEHGQQLTGEQLEDNGAHSHHTEHGHHADLDGGENALFAAGAVVVAHDGHQRVGQTEAGHKHKALQLEIDAQHRNGRLGKADEDLVHAKVHHAA